MAGNKGLVLGILAIIIAAAGIGLSGYMFVFYEILGTGGIDGSNRIDMINGLFS
ncbi:MAG: hypothetical protein JW891_13715 [Candidatus Lokiarchaeota archaeon]|nr:hypothetical protein [Candidatus Lokiarchaeota archaeon]